MQNISTPKPESNCFLEWRKSNFCWGIFYGGKLTKTHTHFLPRYLWKRGDRHPRPGIDTTWSPPMPMSGEGVDTDRFGIHADNLLAECLKVLNWQYEIGLLSGCIFEQTETFIPTTNITIKFM